MQRYDNICFGLVRLRLAAPIAGSFGPSGEGQGGRRVPVTPAACRSDT